MGWVGGGGGGGPVVVVVGVVIHIGRVVYRSGERGVSTAFH